MPCMIDSIQPVLLTSPHNPATKLGPTPVLRKRRARSGHQNVLRLPAGQNRIVKL